MMPDLDHFSVFLYACLIIVAASLIVGRYSKTLPVDIGEHDMSDSLGEVHDSKVPLVIVLGKGTVVIVPIQHQDGSSGLLFRRTNEVHEVGETAIDTEGEFDKARPDDIIVLCTNVASADVLLKLAARVYANMEAVDPS